MQYVHTEHFHLSVIRSATSFDQYGHYLLYIYVVIIVYLCSYCTFIYSLYVYVSLPLP
jgi:hypothetical protein